MGAWEYPHESEAMQYRETHTWITFRLDSRAAPPRFWTLLGEACAKCEHIANIPLAPETAERLHAVYLVKGARATTAIEGNTLSEDDVSNLKRGELRLPPSKEYLGVEVRNILDACDEMLSFAARARPLPPLSAERVKALNAQVLRGLTPDEGVVPGETRRREVGVLRYRGAPARDCEYLLARMCRWLNEMDFGAAITRSNLAPAIIKAIIAHLYIAWIHPFGDGNGRTARLVEHQILLSSGVPSPAAHLLSNHYNETRSEYYRQLDRSSRAPDGAMGFMLYALQGFVDGLDSQIAEIRRQIWRDVWTNYVHSRFRDRNGLANSRRRLLALALSERDRPIPRREIRRLTPDLAERYYGKTDATITRDLNVLAGMGLVKRTKEGAMANTNLLLAFLPPAGTPQAAEPE